MQLWSGMEQIRQLSTLKQWLVYGDPGDLNSCPGEDNMSDTKEEEN